MLFNDKWVKEKIPKGNLKLSWTKHENKTITHQHLWDSVIAVRRGNFVVNTYIKKWNIFPINSLTLYLKELKKKKKRKRTSWTWS